MKFFPTLTLCVSCVMLRAASPVDAPAPASTTGPTVHVDDPGHLLPRDPSAAQAREKRLADFERTAGLKILVRLQLKSPTPDEDKQPGAYMHALATRLGTGRRGALAVYFADEDDWRVWIGDESTPAFVGRPGTAKEFTESGAMHEAKEAFLKKTVAAGETAFAAQQKTAPPGQPPLPAQRLRFQADALLDGLIGRLSPK